VWRRNKLLLHLTTSLIDLILFDYITHNHDLLWAAFERDYYHFQGMEKLGHLGWFSGEGGI